jgi:hypothetical protein
VGLATILTGPEIKEGEVLRRMRVNSHNKLMKLEEEEVVHNPK